MSLDGGRADPLLAIEKVDAGPLLTVVACKCSLNLPTL